jgi:tetraacyldisaccharide 4'-kinase
VYSPFYRMTTDLGDAHAVALPGQRIELAALAAQQRTQGLKIVAAAGIGMPDRFFAMLRARGLDITEIPLHDHFDFRSNPFLGAKTDRILVTEKDAVKCRDHPHLAHDARVWAVTLRTEVDPQLFDLIEKRLKAHGSPLA